MKLYVRTFAILIHKNNVYMKQFLHLLCWLLLPPLQSLMHVSNRSVFLVLKIRNK